MLWSVLFGVLAGLSALLGLWQWAAALRLPLHQRVSVALHSPGVSVLKPLKGCDEFTEKCLRSWLRQDYAGAVQILFGAPSEADPVCGVVRSLLQEFPNADAALVICANERGANAKVSKLVELRRQAKHEVIVASDADVWVPPDFLANAVQPLRDKTVGLVSSPYRFANPATAPMRWEAVAVNADFWSQVAQSNTIAPMDFALGAAMVLRREALDAVGGFEPVLNALADDYQLGNRMTAQGYRSVLCSVVVECWDPPQGWVAVWKHQLRWARTVRACRPGPYFLSLLNNPLLWPGLWLVTAPSALSLGGLMLLVVLRIGLALHLMKLLTPDRPFWRFAGWVIVKDLLGILLWAGAFLGNTVEWRGERMRLKRGGTLAPVLTD